MKIRVVEHFAELSAYREQWNQLLRQSPTNTIFQTFEWLASWWEVFGDGYELSVLLVVDGDVLLAAAPLVSQRKRVYGRRMRCLEFAGRAPADYADFLYRDRVSLQRLVAALRAEVTWQLLDLERIPVSSPTVTILAEEFPGWRGTCFPCDVCPAYVFGAGHDGSDILSKKSIRRHVNGLQKAGTVEVRHLTQAGLIAPELEAFFDQHEERRALTAEPSLFLDPRSRLFYRRLTAHLAPLGRLLFTMVTVDGQPVAFHYGFVYERRLLWYKPSFAVSYARLSPGEVLVAELFKYCRAHELSEFDFTIGDEPFKERFSNVKRQNMKFQAFRSGMFQQLGHADRALRERAKRLRLVRQLYARWGHLIGPRRPSVSPG